MATHSSIFAWEIPWTKEGVQSMGSQRVRHNLVTKPPPPPRTHYQLRVPLLTSEKFPSRIMSQIFWGKKDIKCLTSPIV